MLPRLPPGMMTQSGTCQSNCWQISMAAVFWPSSRKLFMLLARYIGDDCVTCARAAECPSGQPSSHGC